MHIQHQKLETQFIKKTMILSKSRSGCKTPVRNLQHILGPKSGLKRHGCSCIFRTQIIGLSKGSDYDIGLLKGFIGLNKQI